METLKSKTMNCFEQLQNLKIEIKKKYKTLRHFAYSNELELSDVNRFINGRMINGFDRYWDRVIELVELEPRPDPNEITKEQRESISLDIIKNYGSYLNFSRIHPDFSPSFITHVTGGKKKRMNAKVKRMMEYAGKKPE
jgi:hypothetical protein